MRGETVTYKQPENQTPVNGTREHPAIITRQHDETMVNLIVFFDGGSPAPIGSVSHSISAGAGASRWYRESEDEELHKKKDQPAKKKR
jgi:hypothetical protein